MLEELVLFLVRLFGVGELWTSLSSGSKAEVMITVGVFLANIVVSLLGTILLGLIAWFIIHRHQNRVMDQEREMNRLTLLDDFENSMNEIHKQKVVMFPQKDDSPEDELYHLGTAFNHRENWKSSYDEGEPHSIMLDGQRMWKVSEDGTRIASEALQDVILWFRKIHRAYKSNLIDGSDLFVLWHHTVPFIVDHRYLFLETFFSHEDVTDLREIMIITLEHAHLAGKVEIFQYLSKRDDLPYDIDPLFEENADEYFLEHYDRTTEEIIRSHLGDRDHPFPAPPGGDDALEDDEKAATPSG